MDGAVAGNVPARGMRLSFHLWMTLLFALFVFGGFGMTYLWPLAMGTFPHAPPVVHLHGVIFFLWTALLVIQAALVNAGNVKLHRSLGTFGIAQSIATVLTEGNSVTGLPDYVRWFNDGVFLGLPVPIWATALAFAVTYILLYRTKFGRYTFAIGNNRHALILSGSRARYYQLLVYVYAGVLTALASFIMTARLNSAHPTIGIGLEFDAIAAVILGGTSFEKGRGGIIGTIVGALAVGVLRNGLNLMGVSTEWQVAVVGFVIIAAVGLDSLRGLNA